MLWPGQRPQTVMPRARIELSTRGFSIRPAPTGKIAVSVSPAAPVPRAAPLPVTMPRGTKTSHAYDVIAGDDDLV